ncbi:MAG: GNAT family N-acetyltransferase [Firmicutes bacterium]|nr:GNAT family N-acetyltransferase [Bacillota bacterium]
MTLCRDITGAFMKYRLPAAYDRQILKEYVEEHYANGERSISASLGLTGTDYDAWVEKVNRNSKESDDDWGRYYLYLAFDDSDRLIGLLHIRFDLSCALREEYGDIGYGVRPAERRKGYATEMLRYALDVCREKDMRYAVLGCYENNIGSNKTIINNGGVLFRQDTEKKALSEHWEIELKRNYYKIALFSSEYPEKP